MIASLRPAVRGDALGAATRCGAGDALPRPTCEPLKSSKPSTSLIDLAGSCASVYATSGPQTRRQWNQAFFRRVEVFDEDDEASHEPTELFRDILDPNFPGRLQGQEARPPQRRSVGLGSKDELLVGATGFEPLFRTWRQLVAKAAPP
jgi:hypothetical protein